MSAVLLLLVALLTGTPAAPCPSEDSVACTWNATTQGNGEGRSFVAHADGSITYLP